MRKFRPGRRTARRRRSRQAPKRRRAARKLPKPPRPRRRVPLPLKLIGGAILLAARLPRRRDPRRRQQPRLGRRRRAAGRRRRHRSAGTRRRPRESTEELGYPAFATKNTTRVGGGDPAANAAGVALAVFPATDDAQRPAAVTLVDEASPEAAIAAAVLMSAPVRAPILVSGEDGMPAVSAEALAALDPGGSSATGGASVFAIGDVADPGRLRDQAGPGRGAGGDAPRRSPSCATASSAPRPATSSSRRSAQPAFAMPAAAWAARSGDPVLYAGRKKLPKADRRASCAPPEGARLRARPQLGDLLRRAAGSRRDRPAGAPRRRRGPGGERDRPRPLRRRRLRLERQRPRPRLRRRPQRRAARRGGRGAALGGRNLGAAAAHRRRRYASGGAARVPARRQAGLHGQTRRAPSTTTSG